MDSFREPKLDGLKGEGEYISEIPESLHGKVKQTNLVRITSVVSKISRKRSLLITSFRLKNSDDCCQKPLIQQLKVNSMINHPITTLHTKDTTFGRLRFPS